MMKIKSFKFIVPVLLIIFSFVVSFNIFLKRLQYDTHRNKVEFAIHEKDVLFLKNLSGNDYMKMLAILKNQIGITSVVVPEYTIGHYEKQSKVTVLPGYQIINTLRVGQLYRTVLSRLRRKTTIDSNATYIIVDELKIYKRIISHLKLMLPHDSVLEHSGRIIQVNLSTDKVLKIPLGFNSDMLSSYSAYGLQIIPELGQYNVLSKNKLDFLFSELETIEMVRSINFSKFFNYGVASYQKYLSDLIKKSNYMVVYPEFDSSNALNSIVKKMPAQVISAHKIYDYDHFNSFDDLFNRYMRAINERSVNLLILSTLDLVNVNDLYDQNIIFMKRVIDTYKRLGGEQVNYVLNTEAIEVSFIERAIIGLGLFSLMFLAFFKVHLLYSTKDYLFLSAILFGLYLVTIGISSITVPVLGFIAAVIGPVFSIIYFFPNEDMKFISIWDKIFHLLTFMLKVFLVCIFSILCCISLYSDPLFLQNIVPFRGVKLSLLLPVILVGIYFFCGPNRVNSFYYIMRRVLRLPLTASMLMIFASVILILVVYLFRSGNYFQIFNFELNIRNALENFFLVRPRFKEILLGYPALLLGYWYVDRSFNRQFLWLFNGLGVIALSSLINSFCHFHTPVLISFYRSLVGIFLGILFAILFYFVGVLFIRIARSTSFIPK